MATQSDVRGWAAGLDEVLGRIAPRFVRAEPRRRAAACLRGLLASVERKNGWQLAEAAGDATPDAVRGDLQACVVEHLGDAGAVLVLDETGFLRRRARSRRACSGNAAARQGGSRTAKLACSLATPSALQPASRAVPAGDRCAMAAR